MSKGLTATLITLLSVLAIGIVVALVLLLKTEFKFDFTNIEANSLSKKLVEEKEINDIKDLDISNGVADIIIEEQERSTIKVELYSENVKKHSISDLDDKISIVFEQKSSVNFGLFTKSPNIKIYLPKEYDKNIKIDSNVGDIKIAYLKKATTNINLTTGDIKIKDIDTAKIDVRTGDVKIEKINELVSTVGTGDIKVNTAKNIISEVTTGDTKVETVSDIVSKNQVGDTKIQVVKNSLDIYSKTGDVKVQEATIKKNSKITSDVGDVKIGSTKGCYVEGSSKVGDTNINNPDRKSDIILKVTNRIGDIRVN